MKKKIALLLSLAMLVSVFTGCSANMNGYLADTKKVQSWNGYELDSSMTGKIQVDGETLNLSVKAQGKVVANKGVPEALSYKINFAPITYQSETLTIPDLNVVADYSNLLSPTIFIEKAWIDQVSNVFGFPVDDSVTQIKTKYIGFKSVSEADELTSIKVLDLANMMAGPIEDNEFVKMGNTLFKGMKSPIDIKKDGNTYSLTLTDADVLPLVNFALSAIDKNGKEVIKKHKSVLADYLMVDLDENEINKALSEIDKAAIRDTVSQAIESIKGSSLSISETFEKDNYVSKLHVDAKVDQVKAVIDIESSAKRNDKVKIDLPKDVTMIDLAELFAGDFVEDDSIVLYVNDEALVSDQEIVVRNGRSLVPLRATAGMIGATTQWNSKDRSIEVKKDQTTLVFFIDKNEMIVNGKKTKIDVKPEIIDGYTYLPARALAQQFGYNVFWNDQLRTIELTSAA